MKGTDSRPTLSQQIIFFLQLPRKDLARVMSWQWSTVNGEGFILNLLLCHTEMHFTEPHSTEIILYLLCTYIWLWLYMNACISFKSEYFVTGLKLAAVTAVKSSHLCLFASRKEHYQLVTDTAYPGKLWRSASQCAFLLDSHYHTFWSAWGSY